MKHNLLELEHQGWRALSSDGGTAAVFYGLWHEARIAGGRTDGYRSVIAITGGELHYRARYERRATDDAVRGSDPLIYGRAMQ